jgi:hypothetical protein
MGSGCYSQDLLPTYIAWSVMTTDGKNGEGMLG